MKNKRSNRPEGPALVAAIVTPNPASWVNRGVHLVVKEGEHAGKTISLPQDGRGMKVVPYEFTFLVEATMVERFSYRVKRNFLTGDPIDGRSFGNDIDQGRTLAARVVFDQIQKHVAEQSVAPSQATRPSQQYQRAAVRAKIPVLMKDYVFLEPGRYGMKHFAACIVDRNDDVLWNFLQGVAEAVAVEPQEVSLGSMICVNGSWNSVQLYGPKELILGACRFMMDSQDEAWVVLSVIENEAKGMVGVAMTVAEKEFETFDAMSILDSIKKAETKPEEVKPQTQVQASNTQAPQPQAQKPAMAQAPRPEPVKGVKPKVKEAPATSNMAAMGTALVVAGIIEEAVPEVTPEVAPEVIEEAAPEVAPEVTPETAPEVIEEAAPEVAPEAHSDTGVSKETLESVKSFMSSMSEEEKAAFKLLLAKQQ